ncbi:MAG: transporter substrate-binding domain-containing protein [Geminicoccaceae bacterium]
MRRSILGFAALGAALALVVGQPLHAQEQKLFNEYGPQFENCGDDSLDRAIQNGITIGQSNIAPHSMLDPATNTASGIDVEINNAVAEWLGIKDVRYEWVKWAEQVPSLLSKRTDVIGQNIHVNPDRVKVISFSGPAWWYGPVVLVEKGNPDGIKSYDDFKGKDVAAIAGSAAEAYLRRIGANTLTFKSEVEELQSLNQGRVKYVVEDDVIFTVFDKANPGHNIEALWSIPAPDDIVFGGGYGAARYGFRKEDCMLRTGYSVALGELRNNGTVSAILAKYGLSDRNLVWFKLNP